MALNVVVEYVARTIAQSEFRVKESDHVTKDDMYYLLNVRPNLIKMLHSFGRNLFINFLSITKL